MGRFTDIVALKADKSYSHFLSRQREENRGSGAKPREIFGTTPLPFPYSRNTLSEKRALQKRTLAFLCRKGQGPEPPGPLP